MYHLRLCKALSYAGIVSATREQPDVFVEDKATAEKAVATGYFRLVDEAEENDKKEEPGIDYEALSQQTKAELLAYANENGIDVEDCKTKADILEAISAANGGSFTMMELQEV